MKINELVWLACWPQLTLKISKQAVLLHGGRCWLAREKDWLVWRLRKKIEPFTIIFLNRPLAQDSYPGPNSTLCVCGLVLWWMTWITGISVWCWAWGVSWWPWSSYCESDMRDQGAGGSGTGWSSSAVPTWPRFGTCSSVALNWCLRSWTISFTMEV